MATNVKRTEDAQRIAVDCFCSKRLATSAQNAGKLLKCPACGQSVAVPETLPPQPLPTAPPVAHESAGMRKTSLIALCSSAGVFALGCILFLAWHSHSSRSVEIAAANDRISQAVATANEWMDGKSSLNSEGVEQRLANALNDENATEGGIGESVLNRVRQRREQLAQQARVEHAQREATTVFEEAKGRLDGNDVAEAIALLRKYVADHHATKKGDAQRLLTEAETAVSDVLTLDALIAMSDEEFDRVKAAGEIGDGNITHPVLLAVRNETVQRNLPTAVQRREEMRIAEERRREAERMAQTREVQRRVQEMQRQRTLAEQQKREKEHPVAVRPEDVDAFPERYFDKYVAFDKVEVSGRYIERQKDLRGGTFTLAVTTQRKKFFSGVVYDDLFFSCSDDIADSLMILIDAESKVTCKLYCEIASYKTIGLRERILPEAKVYMVDVYDAGGVIALTFSDDEPEKARAAAAWRQKLLDARQRRKEQAGESVDRAKSQQAQQDFYEYAKQFTFGTEEFRHENIGPLAGYHVLLKLRSLYLNERLEAEQIKIALQGPVDWDNGSEYMKDFGAKHYAKACDSFVAKYGDRRIENDSFTLDWLWRETKLRLTGD